MIAMPTEDMTVKLTEEMRAKPQEKLTKGLDKPMPRPRSER